MVIAREVMPQIKFRNLVTEVMFEWMSDPDTSVDEGMADDVDEILDDHESEIRAGEWGQAVEAMADSMVEEYSYWCMGKSSTEIETKLMTAVTHEIHWKAIARWYLDRAAWERWNIRYPLAYAEETVRDE